MLRSVKLGIDLSVQVLSVLTAWLPFLLVCRTHVALRRSMLSSVCGDGRIRRETAIFRS